MLNRQVNVLLSSLFGLSAILLPLLLFLFGELGRAASFLRGLLGLLGEGHAEIEALVYQGCLDVRQRLLDLIDFAHFVRSE